MKVSAAILTALSTATLLFQQACAGPHATNKPRAAAETSLRTLVTEGDDLTARGRFNQALAVYSKELSLRRELSRENPSDVRRQRNVAASLNIVGDACMVLGRNDEALSAFSEARQIVHALSVKNPSDTECPSDQCQEKKCKNMHTDP